MGQAFRQSQGDGVLRSRIHDLESKTKGSIMDVEKVCSDMQEELEQSMKAMQVEIKRLERIKNVFRMC